MKNERELFEEAIVDKCGFNPKTSFELSDITGEYKSDAVYFAWAMWQASANREGFKLVPVVPTMKMCNQLSGNVENAKMIYKAVIGAVDE